MPCVATYNVLEGDRFLDQFEDTDIPFDEAGDVKVGTLRYFPRTTTNPDIIELLALQMAQKFMAFIQKTFTITKHDPTDSAAKIIRDVAAVFADPKRVIKDLAEIVSERVDFPAASPGGGQ
jgi:hypothetical protein